MQKFQNPRYLSYKTLPSISKRATIERNSIPRELVLELPNYADGLLTLFHSFYYPFPIKLVRARVCLRERRGEGEGQQSVDAARLADVADRWWNCWHTRRQAGAAGAAAHVHPGRTIWQTRILGWVANCAGTRYNARTELRFMRDTSFIVKRSSRSKRRDLSTDRCSVRMWCFERRS